MCSIDFVQVMILAAELWTFWSRWRSFWGKPKEGHYSSRDVGVTGQGMNKNLG